METAGTTKPFQVHVQLCYLQHPCLTRINCSLHMWLFFSLPSEGSCHEGTFYLLLSSVYIARGLSLSANLLYCFITDFVCHNHTFFFLNCSFLKFSFCIIFFFFLKTCIAVTYSKYYTDSLAYWLELASANKISPFLFQFIFRQVLRTMTK